MALVACRECSKQISTEATKCPSCGAEPPKKTSLITWAIGAVFAGAVGSTIFAANNESQPAAKVPVDPVAEAKSAARFVMTVRVLTAIKASLREPESLKWDEILANDDGSVVCVEYRARNGFGGMNVEHVAYVGGKMQRNSPSWNSNCAGKSLFEMRSARLALK